MRHGIWQARSCVPDTATGLDSSHPRHVYIEQDCVVAIHVQAAKRFLARARLANIEPEPSQRHAQRAAKCPIVFNYENPSLNIVHARSPRTLCRLCGKTLPARLIQGPHPAAVCQPLGCGVLLFAQNARAFPELEPHHDGQGCRELVPAKVREPHIAPAATVSASAETLC
jgi:hypothetical protein